MMIVDDDHNTSSCNANDGADNWRREFWHPEQPRLTLTGEWHHSSSSSRRPPVSCIAIEVGTARFEISWLLEIFYIHTLLVELIIKEGVGVFVEGRFFFYFMIAFFAV